MAFRATREIPRQTIRQHMSEEEVAALYLQAAMTATQYAAKQHDAGFSFSAWVSFIRPNSVILLTFC
jgi:hypothetical protein